MKNTKQKKNINLIRILKKSGDFTDKELATIALNMSTDDGIPNNVIAPALAKARLRGMREMFDKLVTFAEGEWYWSEKNAWKYYKEFYETNQENWSWSGMGDTKEAW